uniref:Uncharacterized protein n=1 Tax=Tetradesmus obliquus TaxID=3088 RepID=A0A383VP62_TETOB|eukprot:jgi/Sobl393_1/16353/SZX66524.1
MPGRLERRWRSACWQSHGFFYGHTPSAAAAAGVAERALQIPAPPLQWAKQLLAAGVTVTYAQLIHAAHSMVAGVEVWVQAQQELGLQTDVPEAAVVICCPSIQPATRREEVLFLRELQPHLTTPDLLQLAMNCIFLSTAAAAGVAARSLPADLEPQLLRKLLSTVARRQHANAASYMLGLRLVQQHMNAPTLEVLLQMLIAVALESGNSVYMERLHWQWYQLKQAAEGLSRNVVLQLLQTAALLSRSTCAELRLELPAAQQFSTADVLQLLQTAVVHGDEHCLTCMLRELPAAQQLSTDAVVQLLQTAVQQGRQECAFYLLKLPAAEQLSTDKVLQLLQTAVEKGAAAALIDGSNVEQLLLAAVQQGSAAITQDILKLPGAALLSSTAVLQLLQAAVQQGSAGCAALLCQLSTDAVQQLMQRSAGSGSADLAEQLHKLLTESFDMKAVLT